MYGTGFFPSEKNDYYAVPEDGLYLVGTSEVPLIAMHMGEILEELPIRYCAFSSCFRRESGAAGQGHARHVPRAPVPEGRDGRLHRARRSRGTSTSGCSRSRRRSCRRSGCRTASSTAPRAISRAPAAKRYDIEAWFPSQERYREITSCSNTTDYQARRSGIRFRARREAARDAAHAERHRGHRPLGARDPRELRRRRAGGAAGLRRAGARHEVIGRVGPVVIQRPTGPSWFQRRADGSRRRVTTELPRDPAPIREIMRAFIGARSRRPDHSRE